MKIVEIDDKEFRCPEAWSEVNVEKFEKVWAHIQVFGEYQSQYRFLMELFSILLECPYDDIAKITRGGFDQLVELTKWVNSDVEATGIMEWKIEGETWKAIGDLNKIKMEDQVSLEIMIKESNATTLLGNILPIIVRRTDEVNKGDIKIQKLREFDADNYEVDKKKLKQNLMITDVIKLKTFF